jgi:N-formylmaleamate deformylase
MELFMKASMLALFTCLMFTIAHAQQQYSFGVRVSGKGRPMILIPGNKGSADTYNEVVDHYKSHYTCYIITLAGFAGQPPSGATDHFLLKQRDDIIRYIIEKHLDKPVLVGFSFGGTLATWIACARPDLIGPFIDIDGTPFDAAVDVKTLNKDSLIDADGKRYTKALSRNADYWKTRDALFHSPMGVTQGVIELQKLMTDTSRIKQVLEWDKMSDFKTGVLINLEADTLDLRDGVAKIKSPILMLGSWKGYDVIKSKAEAEKSYAAQYAKAKNVTMVFSENGKHFLMWEDFDWMISEMDKFLKKAG